MQTKQQIQQLLSSAGTSPNKRLGQHFLIDLNLMRLLINLADIKSDDVVLEVGCGTGSLTEEVAQKAGAIVAVEIDSTVAKIAENQLADKINVTVISGDILEKKSAINPIVIETLESARKKYSGRFLLVANLPYSAACPVMFNLIKGPVIADAMFVTVQREVAERCKAGPADRLYGILSIFMAVTGDVKVKRVLKPTVFWPEPQVASAMVSFVRDQEKAGRIKDMELLGDLVALFMQHRRKMLKASTRFTKGPLAKIESWQEIFEKCSINPKSRPETLKPDDFLAIANLCGQYLEMQN